MMCRGALEKPLAAKNANRRLYYLTSHLNTEGTSIENWKLPLVSKAASVKKFLSK